MGPPPRPGLTGPPAGASHAPGMASQSATANTFHNPQQLADMQRQVSALQQQLAFNQQEMDEVGASEGVGRQAMGPLQRNAGW